MDDWFESEIKDKKERCITVEVRVKADHVLDVQNAVLDRVLKIIDEKHDDFKDGSFRDDSITYAQAWKRSNEAIKEAVLALQGGNKT